MSTGTCTCDHPINDKPCAEFVEGHPHGDWCHRIKNRLTGEVCAHTRACHDTCSSLKAPHSGMEESA